MPKKEIKITETHKECSKCEQMILIEKFSKDKDKPYGIASWCKECRHKYYNIHRTRFLMKRKLYRETNPEKIKIQKRESYVKHRTEIRKRAKINYQNNKAEILEKNKIWRKFSLRGRFMDCKLGAKKRNINFEIALEKFNNEIQKPCSYCGTIDKKRGLDRIDNTKGYTNDNVTSCCWQCNWMKNNLTVHEFINKCKDIIKNTKLELLASNSSSPLASQ